MNSVKRALLGALLQSGLVDFKTTSLVKPAGLTSMEMMVLRNIVDNARQRGVTDANKAEHDSTLISLIKRGLVSYHKKRARRFDLTPTGCKALAEAEEKQGEVLGMTEIPEVGDAGA